MPRYNALYIERKATNHPHGKTLLRLFSDRRIIVLEDYGEFFNRPNQDFQGQKSSPALVAAVGTPPFLYEATERVVGQSDLPVYYNDQLRNCVYNCEYCFLQGMHASGHTLVYVNSEDFQAAAARRGGEGPYWLSISYLTDILAFEETLPLVSEWISFSDRNPGITFEVRTKGEASPIVRSLGHPGVVLVWSLSPPSVASRHESGCASFQNRLFAAETALRFGWRVRLAFDPVILVPGWKQAYTDMLATVFRRLPPDRIEAATYGVFRMGADYMGRIATSRRDSTILHHPFTREQGLVTYSPEEIEAVHTVVGIPLLDQLGPEKVSFVHG